jgi:FAD/FMN-containing dehydrogenase
MTRTVGGGIDALRAGTTGTVLLPGDEGYDSARSLWNGELDRHPAVIVRCAGPSDVVAALAFAREQDLGVTVRGGGHNTSGAAAVDGALMIDLSLLRDVAVDPVRKLAMAGGGATLAELDAATQEHGLATTGGMISHTGIGGLTLGGGMGWLTRRHGLAVDNLVSAEVVTADGQILRASESEHTDLFWALRGGGGNFGVVTRFEYRLHEVGPLVQVGMLFFDLHQGTDVLRLTREVLRDLPTDLALYVVGVNAPPAPFVPPEYHFRPGFAMVLAGFGPAEQHAEHLDALRSAVAPLFELVTPMPYVALQRMFDDGAAWGTCCYQKALFVDDLTDDAISVITEHLPRKTSPMTMLEFYTFGGAYAAVHDDATAFGGSRSARIGVLFIGLTADPEQLPAEREWLRAFWDALVPHSLGAGYVNSMTEYGGDRVRALYGPKYARLSQIKSVYDPTNVFRHNANIPPI